MRAVFLGAGSLAEELDCGFLHGDGSKPALLREADPAKTDFLFCLTGNDQTNILASPAGRCLGYGRVVPEIDAPEFEYLCIELGLDDAIIPARTTGRYLADLFEGHDQLEIIALVKDEARVFSIVAREADEKPINEPDLPEDSRVMFYYRDEKFTLPEPDSKLKRGDEVMLITHSRNIGKPHQRWSARAPLTRAAR